VERPLRRRAADGSAWLQGDCSARGRGGPGTATAYLRPPPRNGARRPGAAILFSGARTLCEPRLTPGFGPRLSRAGGLNCQRATNARRTGPRGSDVSLRAGSSRKPRRFGFLSTCWDDK
jgi:hypothetical protein